MWRGDVPLVLARDPNQLPPYCGSSNIKYANGRAVNAFSMQVRISLLERFRENNFPFWIIPEQLRIEPGLFDLANMLHYNNKIAYGKNNKLSDMARVFER